MGPTPLYVEQAFPPLNPLRPLRLEIANSFAMCPHFPMPCSAEEEQGWRYSLTCKGYGPFLKGSEKSKQKNMGVTWIKPHKCEKHLRACHGPLLGELRDKQTPKKAQLLIRGQRRVCDFDHMVAFPDYLFRNPLEIRVHSLWLKQ